MQSTEFVIGSVFPSSHEADRDFLKRGSIVEFPDDLCVRLDVDPHDFCDGLVGFVVPPVYAQGKSSVYRRVFGTYLFRHTRTGRTCRLIVSSDHLQASPTVTTAVTRIVVADDVGAVQPFLTLCSALVRMEIVPWREVVRHDRRSIAIRHSELSPVAADLRRALESMGCELQVSVVFSAQGHSASHRCLLVPSCLLHTGVVARSSEVWTVVTFPAIVPTQILTSNEFDRLFGRPAANLAFPECLEAYVTTMAMRRLAAEVAAVLSTVQPSETYETSLECLTRTDGVRSFRLQILCLERMLVCFFVDA